MSIAKRQYQRNSRDSLMVGRRRKAEHLFAESSSASGKTAPPRRILINALTAKAGGFRGFVVSFLREIDRDTGAMSRYIVYLPAEVVQSLEGGLRTVEIHGSRVLSHNEVLRILWEQCVLPFWARWRNVDLLVSASSLGPRYAFCPHVIWLRNALPFSVEYEALARQDWRERLRLKALRWLIRWAVGGAWRIIVQQSALIGRVRRFIPAPVETFRVVPNAPLPATGEVREEIGSLRRNYEGRFIINGIQYYHRYRNIEVLVEGVQRLVLQGHADILLLLSVDPEEDPPGSRRFVETLNRSVLEGRGAVINFGRVSLAEVHSLYGQSDLAVFPSLAESFSNAYLVAMGHGIPIVASDFDFSRGVLGEGALYFNYRDAGDLAGRIARVKTDTALREQLGRSARERFLEYRWDRTYRAFIEAISDGK